MSEAKFGEPWDVSDRGVMGDRIIVDCDGIPIRASWERRKRSLVCVNAFAWVDDPAEVMAAVRDYCEAYMASRRIAFSVSATEEKYEATIAEVGKALSRLRAAMSEME